MCDVGHMHIDVAGMEEAFLRGGHLEYKKQINQPRDRTSEQIYRISPSMTGRTLFKVKNTRNSPETEA